MRISEIHLLLIVARSGRKGSKAQSVPVPPEVSKFSDGILLVAGAGNFLTEFSYT
jgi:hypothetical protein